MHAEIGQAAPSTCPVCGMALVAVDDERTAPYLLDLSVAPPSVPPGRPLALRFVVRDPMSREVVRELAVVHERPFHLFLVSADLAWFDHVHPVQQSDGGFLVELRLPRAGRYQLIADFTPVGAPPQLVQRALVTEGWRGPLRHVRL